MSIDEAKRTAIDRARIQAIADYFGTTVSQSNSTIMSNNNGSSDTQFFSLGGSDVKGEWIADTKAPTIDVSYEDNMVIVSAEVWGKAREYKKADLELLIKTLCNGLESDKFHHNDKLSILFKSPVKGFLSIWLADDNLQQTYCLLPYETGNGEAREIKNQTNYSFLSTADNEYPYKEETILIADNDLEINRLIFVFSPNKFSMPLTEKGEYLPQLTTQKFDKWLQKNRLKDENMYVVQKIIEISK